MVLGGLINGCSRGILTEIHAYLEKPLWEKQWGYNQMQCCDLQVKGLVGGILQYSIKLESSVCKCIGGEKVLKCRWHLLRHENENVKILITQIAKLPIYQ